MFNLIFLLSYLLSNVNPALWLCWYSSKINSQCGTYGWASSKKEAQKAAKELCDNHCQDVCVLDYCEINQKNFTKENKNNM